MKSSAMLLRELTGWTCAFSGVCSHIAFKCSGSGAREVGSLNALGDFGHSVD